MIYKTPNELQQIAKSANASDAILISSILHTIIDKTPDEFLKKHNDKLIELLPIYENHRYKEREFLNQKLSNLKEAPAIESIIIMHILQSIKNGGSKIHWPEKRKKFKGLPAFIIPPDILDEMHEYIQSKISAFPREAITEKVSEWAERKRTIGSGLTARAGRVDFSVTPFLREIVDCLSDNSPIQEVYLIKGTQLGGSVMVLENHMGYCIDYGIGPLLYVGGDDKMAQDVIEKRVDEMIYSAGLQGKIKANIEKAKGKSKGDRKEANNIRELYKRCNAQSRKYRRRTVVLIRK